MHDGTPGAADAASTPCPNGCGQNVNPRGRGSHNRSCKALAAKPTGDGALRARIEAQANAAIATIQDQAKMALETLATLTAAEIDSPLYEVAMNLNRISARVEEHANLVKLLAD